MTRMSWVAALLLLAAGAPPAEALGNCSGTIGTTAGPLPLPAAPTAHLEITNPAENTNHICVAPVGTAACGAAGSVTIVPGGDRWWDAPDLPSSASIVASGANTPYQCDEQ